MSPNRKPYFRFNPNAYEPGRAFLASDEPCEVCRRPCVWQYNGSIYSQENPSVCASCIADGSVERAIEDKWFSFHDITLDDVDPVLENELLRRTPGVSCFNPFVWPVLDGKPLAFLHYGDDSAVNVFSLPRVKSAIAEAFAEFGFDASEPGPYALLFKEIDGDRYRVTIDLD